MQFLLYEPSALISNKADCPYFEVLLRPFCNVSALALKMTAGTLLIYVLYGYIGLGSYVTQNVLYLLRSGKERIFDIVPGGT